MKRLLCFIVLNLICVTSFPQDLSAVKDQLDALCSGLQKDSIKTGFLWDVAVNLVDGQEFNGSFLTDSNYVDIPRLYDMVRSINSAAVKGDTISVNNSIGRIQRNSSLNDVRVGFLFQPYNYIVSDALTNNRISFNNGVVSDRYVNGIWIDPYEEDVLVGYAVGNNGVVGLSVSYMIENIDSLSTQSFSDVQFDAGDGVFRPVSIGVPFSFVYTQPGIKETRLLLRKDNQDYYSHSLIKVTAGPHYAPFALGYDTHEVVAYDGIRYYRGMVSYKTGTSFDNPLIVAEGFDPWRLKQDAQESDVHSYSGFTTLRSFLYEIDSLSVLQNYNIFYIDWEDYGADIRCNAKVLEEAIKWINANNTSGNANVVLGQSMGGLISRYCLRDMENRGVLHNTKLLISHDAPHLGANISPGLMYAYWDIHKYLHASASFLVLFDSLKDVVPELLRLGYYTSVRQMLPNYINNAGNRDASAYINLQQDLIGLGFPQGDPGLPLENVAIVNGGRVSSGGGLMMYDGTTKLLNVAMSMSTGIFTDLLSFFCAWVKEVPILPGKTTIDFNYEVYPFLNHSSPGRKVSLLYTKKLLWLWDIPIYLINETKNNPSSGVLYDKYSSSYYDVSSTKFNPDSLDYNSPTSGWAPFWGSISLDVDAVPKLAFIPTASAFSYNGADALYRDFFVNGPVIKDEVPFNSYVVQNTQTRHIDFWDINGWLTSVLSEINVPPVVFSGDTLSVPGALGPFNWSSSSEQVASVDSSTGIIGNTTSGIVEFKASFSSFGEAITKTRESLVGYPEVTLSVSSINSNMAVVQTIPVNPLHTSFIDSAVDQGVINYKWGIKRGSSTIEWRVNQSDTIHVSFTDIPSTPITVYMKWIRGTEEETETREKHFSGNGYESNIELICVHNNMFMFTESFSTAQITSLYGHKCLVFKTSQLFANLPSIVSATIQGQTYPVTAPYNPLPGISTFIFDILFDNTFRNLVLMNPRFIRTGVLSLTIVLNDSDGPIQKCTILCTRDDSPFL